MEQIKKTRKTVLYITFILLLGSFAIFSCTNEDNSNLNDDGGFKGIVNGRLIAMNMDYMSVYGYSTTTAGINTTDGSGLWQNNKAFSLIAPYNSGLYSVAGINFATFFTSPVRDAKIFNTDFNTGLLSDSVRYTGKLFFSSSFYNNAAYHFGSNGVSGYSIYKYNSRDTTPSWTKNISLGYSVNILALANLVYYSSKDSICALNSSDGSLAWATKLNLTGSPSQTTLLYNNNKLYVGANAATANFFCLNAQTGGIAWSGKIISTNKYQTAYSIEGNNLVLAEEGTSGGKKVFCVDKNTGTGLWSFTAANAITSSPTIKNDKVYFSAGDSLFCVNASNGSVLWKHYTNTVQGSNLFTYLFTSSPIVADSAAIFSSGGSVITLSTNTGNLMWQYNFSGTSTSRATFLNAFILRDSIYYPGGAVLHK